MARVSSPRRPTRWARSVACRGAGRRSGRRDVPRGRISPGSPPLPADVVRGLQISRGDVRQHLLFQGQVRHKPPQPSVLALQILHLPRLVDLQAAVLLAPAIVALLGDLRLLARQRQTLALGCLHLDLAQLQHDLLRARLLTSLHVPAPSVLADPLNQPGPKPAGQVSGDDGNDCENHRLYRSGHIDYYDIKSE